MKVISSIILALVLISGCTIRNQTYTYREALLSGDTVRQKPHEKYPDYLYTIVGLLTVEGPFSVWENFGNESFGTFWQDEYHVALELYSVLLSLRDKGIISGSVTINTDEVGRTYVSSKSGKELLSSLFESAESFNDFLGNATDDQMLLYLKSIYKRWGVAEYNLLINPRVDQEMLIQLLSPHTSGIYTINDMTSIPGIRVIIFKPLDDFALLLGINQQADITIAPAQKLSPDLLIRKLPHDTYDDRYSISLHLSQLNRLDNAELELRLKYLDWAKSELRRDLEFDEQHDPQDSIDTIAEIKQLIKRIDEAIAQHLH